MNPDHQFLSRLLNEGSRALAAYAANELLAARPEAEAGFGPDPFSGWRDWLAVRVQELAAAVAADQPRLFQSQVQWAKAALAARGVAPEDFRAALQRLRDVLAEELPEKVAPVAIEYLEKALGEYDRQLTDASIRLLPDDEHGRLASAYLLALLEGDRRRAGQGILEALQRGSSVRNLYLQVLLPAQAELGRMWLVGEINVAEEHFASQTTKTVMAQLLARATFQPRNGKTMLAAAVVGNEHDIGLLAVANFFEMAGWRTVQLGANVPMRDLVHAVECFEVDLLGLSASQTTQLETVATTIQAVRSGSRGDAVKILVGGFAFADSGDLPHELGADGCTAGVEEAVQLGNRLVGLS